jgi:hypothetical protein
MISHLSISGSVDENSTVLSQIDALLPRAQIFSTSSYWLLGINYCD